MKYFYVIKDGTIEARCSTRDSAMDLIRINQEKEKKAHQWLHANFSIIEGGKEEFISYE